MISTVYDKIDRLHFGDKTYRRKNNIAQLIPSPLPNTLASVISELRSTVLQTEVLHSNDPREKTILRRKAQIIYLVTERFESGAFSIALREETGSNSNIIQSRYG